MIKLDKMVLKTVNWVHNVIKLVYQMVLTVVNCVHNDKNEAIWSWNGSIAYTITKLGQMVLKVVNWVHNDKIRSNGIERSQLGSEW